MTFSSLVAPGNVRSSPQRSPRNGTAVDHFILHHSAAFDVNQVLNEMVTGSKQVSANYVVANDGTIYGVVDEEDRAWTSGSSTDGGKGAAWDQRSITFEILDQTGAPDWLISPAAEKSVSMIVADYSKRHGITPQRDGSPEAWTVYGHRELYTIYGASYSTACPGGMDLNGITQTSHDILKGTPMSNVIQTRVIRKPSTGAIVMLHPTGVANVGDTLMPDLASASGAGLLAGQPANDGSLDANSKGFYWIDLPSTFDWEVSRHVQLVATADAHLKSLVGAPGTTAPVDLSPVLAQLAALEATLTKGYTFNVKPSA